MRSEKCGETGLRNETSYATYPRGNVNTRTHYPPPTPPSLSLSICHSGESTASTTVVLSHTISRYSKLPCFPDGGGFLEGAKPNPACPELIPLEACRRVFFRLQGARERSLRSTNKALQRRREWPGGRSLRGMVLHARSLRPHPGRRHPEVLHRVWPKPLR